MSEYLGFQFVDAADVIRFNDDGTFDSEKTNELMREKLASMDSAVVPGFYGAYEDGRVKTFSRGGSDVTGSIVARAVKADVYENWTDVSGFMIADPRIIDSQRKSRLSHIENFVSFHIWVQASFMKMQSSRYEEKAYRSI